MKRRSFLFFILNYSFFIIICCLSSYGQGGMSVENFRLIENDLTAITNGTQETDQNGEVAALIKIVTPERGFTFDGGMLGIVRILEREGEIWLYVPRRAQHLTINHRYFGKLSDYYYPLPIEGGRTYEMRLDIGTGRYISITAPVDGAEIAVDGKHVGKAPVYNYYLHFGPHTIEASVGRHEGVLKLEVTQDTERGAVVSVPMQDQSALFGDVVVEVDGRADILFQGRKVGTGTWRTQLKEGAYTVETARANADTARTSFNVLRGQMNRVQATAPTPHTGYISVYTRPRNVEVVFDGRTQLDMSQTQSLPVGRHELQFSRKGYVPQTHSYMINRGETVLDTVTLERVKYVKPLAFYFGGGYTYRNLSGATAMAGAVFHNHDFQVSYTFGLGRSAPVYWYDDGGHWLSTMTYRQNSLGVRYGYQINLLRQLAITPQVGYSYETLQGTLSDGAGRYAHGAKGGLVSAGMKLLVVPFQHCYIFIAPEYGISLGEDTYLNRTAAVGDFKTGGFAVTGGLLFSF